MKRQTKAEKKAFIEKLADEAEVAAQTQNIATLYKITKILVGGFRNNDVPVKGVNEDVIIGIACRQTQR